MFRTSRLRQGVTSAPLRRRAVGMIAALALGISALSGCAAGQISQSVDQVPNQDGAEATAGVIGVRNALVAEPTSASEGSAVAYPKGASAPLTFWLTNASNDDPDTLTAITTAAGTVNLDGTATVEPQSHLQVGGSDAGVTATITDLSEPLRYGVSIPVTFSFAAAGDVSVNIPVAIPAERTGDRQSTDIYPAEPTNLWGD